MSADDSSHQAFNGKVVQPLGFPIPLAGRIREGQVSWSAGFQESLFKMDGKFLGKPCPHKPCRHNRVAVTDKLYGFFSGDDFTFLHVHGPYWVKHWMFYLSYRGILCHGLIPPFFSLVTGYELDFCHSQKKEIQEISYVCPI